LLPAPKVNPSTAADVRKIPFLLLWAPLLLGGALLASGLPTERRQQFGKAEDNPTSLKKN